jgi:opacity protein-like surface antigen
MNCDRRFLHHVLAGAAIGAMVLANPVRAADLPLKAPQFRPAFDWSGFYVGGHTGYGRGSSSPVLTDPLVAASSGTFGGVIGGVQGGYNVRLPSGLLLGVEADLTFPNYLPSNSIASRLTTARSDVFEQWDYIGTARGRIGYANGHWLAYATGGLAFAGERFVNSPAVGDEEKHIQQRLGWAAGAGLEYAFAPHWSVRLEYLYSQFGRADIRFPSGAQYNSSLDFHSLRIGLNRKVDWPGSSNWTPKTDLTDPESDRWEIHGQTTYLPQGYPAFRALYTGPNSLTPAPQAQATWSNSLFLNARLWEGGEVYYNPELLQGFGLNDTVGAGGFPNGEAQKSTPLPALQHLAAVPALTVTSASAANRRSWQRLASSAARSTSPTDGSAPANSPSSTCSTATPTKERARISLTGRCGRRARWTIPSTSRPQLWRHRRAQSEAMGAARLFPDAVGLQLQQFRHQRRPARHWHRRSWKPPHAVLAARQAAPSPGSTAPFRQLPRR